MFGTFCFYSDCSIFIYFCNLIGTLLANLRKTLCHTKLPSKNHSKRNLLGSQKCNYDGCMPCSYTSEAKQFKSSVTNMVYKSTTKYTCQSVGVIYLVTCQKCKKQYVGQTGRSARTRCLEHLRYLKSKTEATGIHFNERGHEHKDFQFHIIEKVIPNTPQMRLQRENYWIQTLNTKTPRGLNRNTI